MPMKIFDVKLKITRDGYVKDEDELSQHQSDARAIVQHYLSTLASELDSAGYRIHVISDADIVVTLNRKA